MTAKNQAEDMKKSVRETEEKECRSRDQVIDGELACIDFRKVSFFITKVEVECSQYGLILDPFNFGAGYEKRYCHISPQSDLPGETALRCKQ